MPLKPIYFDYNATSPVLPGVYAAMEPYFKERFGNPSSGHAWGLPAKQAVNQGRRQVAGLIGCLPEELVFTSCASESINTVLKSAFWSNPAVHLVMTAIEHPASLECAAWLESQGARISRIGVNRQGVVDPDEVLNACGDEPSFISVMLANNETGAIQPVEEIAVRARERGIPVHTDASQAAGKIAVDIERLGVDYLTIAGHKLYAPKGIGALFVRKGRKLHPLLHGGGQENAMRSGTENVAFIAGLGEACRMASGDLPAEEKRQRQLGTVFLEGLNRLGADYLLHSADTLRLPQTMFIGFKGLRAADILSGLVGYDVAASGGAACHGAETTLSYVLEAMNAPHAYAGGTLRFSWGRLTGLDDVEEVVRRLGLVLESLKPAA